jgi:hypothetical protein
LQKVFDFNVFGVNQSRIINARLEVLSDVVIPIHSIKEEQNFCSNVKEDGNHFSCFDDAKKPYACLDKSDCYSMNYIPVTSFITEKQFIPVSSLEKKTEIVNQIDPVSVDEAQIISIGTNFDDSEKVTLDTPILHISAGDTKIYKFSWDCPILGNDWGCSGAWALNPSGFFNPAWSFRQLITIHNPNPFTVTNYTVRLDINNSVSDTNFWTNVDSNGNDVRFLNSDNNTILNHFDENFDFTGQTYIGHVTIPSLPSGDTNIFMYWGNPVATNTSLYSSISISLINSGNTFAGWKTRKVGGNDWITNGTNLTNDSGSGTQVGYRNSDSNADYNKSMVTFFRMTFKIDGADTSMEIVSAPYEQGNTEGDTSLTNNYFITRNLDPSHLKLNFQDINNSACIVGTSPLVTDTFYTGFASRGTNGIWRLYVDGTFQGQCTDANITLAGFPSISHAGGPNGIVNFYSARKTLPSETGSSFGVIEFNPSVTADFNYTLTTIDSNHFNLTLIDTSFTSSGSSIIHWRYFKDNVIFYDSITNGNTSIIIPQGDFNISLLIDTNISTQAQEDKQIVTSFPVIKVFDLNIMSTSKYGATMQCSNNVDSSLFYTLKDNNVTVFSESDLNDFVKHLNNFDFNFAGANRFQFFCQDSSGNIASSAVKTIILVSVKIPKDADTLNLITPFNLSSSDLNINLTGLTNDMNFATLIINVSITVDANDDYFPTTFIIDLNTSEAIQPYLVPKSSGLETTVNTIDNIQGRTSLPYIFIESYATKLGNVLVESKFSDGTGEALFHFIRGDTYVLKFYTTDKSRLLLTTTIVAHSDNLLIFLNTAVPVSPVTIVGSYTTVWNPKSGLLIADANSNVRFSVIIHPIDTTIKDVNVIITQDGNLVFSQLYTLNTVTDYNLVVDFNGASVQPYTNLIVRLVVRDQNDFIINGNNTAVGAVQTYLVGVADIISNSFNNFREGGGILVTTIIAVLLAILAIGQIALRRFNEDNNFLFVGAIIITGFFAFVGWINFAVWITSVLVGGVMTLYKVRE